MKKQILLVSGMCCLILSSYSFAEGQRGQKIYEHGCQTCHSPAISPALKSPAYHDEQAWQKRYDEAKAIAKTDPKYASAMAYMIAQVKNGRGAMVAGGMCADSTTADEQCTDASYEAAIRYMSQLDKE